MKLKEIVFPIDFSGRSVEVCPYVAALTQRLGARLTLLHVIEASADLERRKERTTHQLSAFQHQYIPHVPSEPLVLAGDPADSIVAYGGEGRERMIVMPTRGFGPFRQMLLGSVTAKVVHDSKCPVLTGPHLEAAIHPADWFQVHRIMCAVGLDWETDEILEHSAALAEQLDAELLATHVVSPLEEGLLPLVLPGGAPLCLDSAQKALQQQLDRLGISAGVHVTVGEVARRVASAAKQFHTDLIVIGKGGRPEQRGRLGSHGYSIIRRAPCPVLCI